MGSCLYLMPTSNDPKAKFPKVVLLMDRRSRNSLLTANADGAPPLTTNNNRRERRSGTGKVKEEEE